MSTSIRLKKSAVSSNAPTTGDIDYGELAINYADGKLYYKTASNTIDYFSAGAGGGSSLWTENGDDIYYDSGNVGIGVTSPGEALEVDGNVEITGEFIGDLRGPVTFKAQASENLTLGDAVYISGVSGQTPTVGKADADDASKMPAFGLVSATTTSGNPCTVVTFGTFVGYDTVNTNNSPSWALGDTLYVDTTAGGLTNVPPTGESFLIQNIGKVQRIDATDGRIKVGGAGRTNATPNLNEGRLFVGNASNQAVADDTVHIDIANTRVGIGTTAPAKILTISSNANSQSTATIPGIRIENTDTTAVDTDVSGEIEFFSKDASETDKISGFIKNVAEDAGTKYGLSFGAKTSGANATEAMRINHAGDVGIGTTAPAHKLSVFGDSSGNRTEIGIDNIDQRLVLGAYFETGVTQYSTIQATNNSEATATNLILQPDGGNVGIGTTSPDAVLNLDHTTDTRLRFNGGTTGASYGIDWGFNSSSLTYASVNFDYDTRASSGLQINSAYTITFNDIGTDGAIDAELMRITNAGLVGIGTSSPGTALEISRSSGSTQLTMNGVSGGYKDIILETGGSARWRFGADNDAESGSNVGSDFYINAFSDAGAYLSTALWIKRSTGNVGIGTTTPQTNLDVSGSNSGDICLQLRSGDTSDGTDSSQIVFAYNGASYNSTGYAHSIRTRHNGGADTGNAIDFWLWDYGTDTSSTLGSKRVMTIEGTGRVGIGTSSPDYNLEVIGTFRNSGALWNDDSINLNRNGAGYIRHRRIDQALLLGVTNTAGTLYYPLELNPASNFVKFSREGGVETMRINSAGNVGIGTASPSYKLVINDDASTGQGLHVTGGGGGGTIARFERDVGHSGSYIDINVNSGDPQIRFTESSGVDWAIGVEANVFEIVDGSNLGGTSALEISSSGATFSGTLSASNLSGTNTGDQSASQILTAIKTVDGSGSGLDADTVDGIQGSSFLRSDAGDVASQRIEFQANATNNWDSIDTATGSLGNIEIYNSGSGNDAFMTFHVGGDFACYFGLAGDTNVLSVGGWSMGANKYRILLGDSYANTGNVVLGGHLTVGNGLTSSDIYMTDSDQGTRRIHCNSNRVGFLNQSSGWGSWCNDDGSWETAERIIAGYDSGVANSINCTGWFRTSGQTGIFFASYGGGVYQTNSTEVTIYNSKILKVNNDIRATGNVTAYYSDMRLKTKVGTLDNALDKVNQLEGFLYVENEVAKSVGYENPDVQIGLSAQKVQEVCPEVVSLAPFDVEVSEFGGEVSSKSGEDYLTVDYARLVPLLVESIKELTTKNQELENRLKKLEDRD